jgi:hypothetical protein
VFPHCELGQLRVTSVESGTDVAGELIIHKSLTLHPDFFSIFGALLAAPTPLHSTFDRLFVREFIFPVFCSQKNSALTRANLSHRADKIMIYP